MKSVVNFSACIFILLPIFLLLFLVYYFSEHLFFADDFHLLKTIVWLQDTDDFSQKLGLLVQQHNEHRILVPRILTWLNCSLIGYIDWPLLMLFGNALWCSVLYFLWDAFRTFKLSPWYFIPIPWLLLQPDYYDNYTWSISVLQQSVIVFLLAWLVHAFANRRFVLAVFILLLGTFTHGNGIFGVGVGVVFLVLYREWEWLGYWLAICALTAGVYFYDFGKGQNADFLQSLSHPAQMIGYFFAFFGSVIELGVSGSGFSVFWGLVTLGGTCWFVFSKLYILYRDDISLSYFDKMLLGNLLFLVITALLAAVARSWSSPELDIPPRYAHYSPYLSAWFYLVVLAILARRAGTHRALLGVAAVLSVGAILVSVASHLNHFSNLEYRRDWLWADANNWHNYGTFMQYAPSFNYNIKETYTEAVSRGISRPPVSPPDVSASHIFEDSTKLLAFEKFMLKFQDASGDYYEKVLSIRDDTYLGDTPFLLLIPDQGSPIWIPFYRSRNGYRSMVTDRNLRKPELYTQILTDNLPIGVFRVGYRRVDKLILTRYRLEVGSDHEVKLL